jgi:hypothetical protein
MQLAAPRVFKSAIGQRTVKTVGRSAANPLADELGGGVRLTDLPLKRSSFVTTTGIAAEVEMNNNAPAPNEKCSGVICGKLSQLTDRFLIDQRNPYQPESASAARDVLVFSA